MARTFSAGNFLSNASAVKSAAPFTFLLLAKPSGTTGVRGMMKISDATFANIWEMLQVATTNVPELRTADGGSGAIAAATTGPSAGNWSAAGAVVASTTSRAAFNDGGDKGSSISTRTPAGVGQTEIGRGSPASVTYIGDLAEAAILDSDISDTDIATLQTPRSGGYVRPVMAQVLGYTVLAYWPIYGQASPEPDKVGGFDMSITGSLPQATHAPVYDTRRNHYLQRMAG